MYKYAQTKISKFIIAGIFLMFACVFAIRVSNSTTGGADTNNHFSLHRTNYVELEDPDWYMKYDKSIDKLLKLNSTYIPDNEFFEYVHQAKSDADSDTYDVNAANQDKKVYQLTWVETFAKRYTSKPFSNNFKTAIHQYRKLQRKQ